MILESFGFNVRVLDGGLKKYLELGYPTEAGTEYTGEKSTIGSLEGKYFLRKLEDIHEFNQGNREGFQLIDLRSAKAFNGDDEDTIKGCREGHIEGAINIPLKEFLNEDTTFKSTEKIQELIEKYNLDVNKETVFM